MWTQWSKTPTADLTDPWFREPCGHIKVGSRVDYGWVLNPSLDHFMPGFWFRVMDVIRSSNSRQFFFRQSQNRKVFISKSNKSHGKFFQIFSWLPHDGSRVNFLENEQQFVDRQHSQKLHPDEDLSAKVARTDCGPPGTHWASQCIYNINNSMV